MFAACVVVLFAASCSTSSSNESAPPPTTLPVATLAPTASVGPVVPAADQISVSSVFAGLLDVDSARGDRFRGTMNIVNSSDSYIAASSLEVEYVQGGTVNDLSTFAQSGTPLVYLAPGDNWFAFRSTYTMPVEGYRLRPPEAEYADPPGSFEVTLERIPTGGGEVAGTVVSNWPTDVTGVSVGIVWFDPLGNPVVGLDTLVVKLEAGESRHFVIETSVLIDESWTFIAYGIETLVFMVPAPNPPPVLDN